VDGPLAYCPHCGAEYRPGFVTCPDCRVDLVDTPPRTEDEEHFTGPIVELTRLPSRFEADILIAKLQSAGMRAVLDAGDAGGWYPNLGMAHGYRVLVADDDLDDARQLLPLASRAGPVRWRRRSSSS
jgi:hypothetical protein